MFRRLALCLALLGPLAVAPLVTPTSAVAQTAVQLTADERAYVDGYHADVLARVGPLLDGEVKAWLEGACAPLK